MKPNDLSDCWSFLFWKEKREKILHKPYSVFLGGSVSRSVVAPSVMLGLEPHGDKYRTPLKVADRTSRGFCDKGKWKCQNISPFITRLAEVTFREKNTVWFYTSFFWVFWHDSNDSFPLLGTLITKNENYIGFYNQENHFWSSALLQILLHPVLQVGFGCRHD